MVSKAGKLALFCGPGPLANMESIEAADYQIHFNSRAYKALKEHLDMADYSSVFILVDENTRRDCLAPFLKGLDERPNLNILQLPSGEEHKNLESCLQVWEQLSEQGADRKSLLINLGGGVLTDLGGFVASTFKRGIHFINVPTTLLAMVDASIGGKTGVDLGPLKNQIGVINQPVMVLVIPEFLTTLVPRQLRSGFAEMLKHGLIQNKGYWAELRELTSLQELDKYIIESIQIKHQVVLQDPGEKHLRKILNFGHTLGHAVESYFLKAEDRESLLHGEAIAIGMVLEAYLSHKLAGLPEAALEEIRDTFRNRYPETTISGHEKEQILGLLQFDKKNTHGKVNFVLLRDIGQPEIDVTVPPYLLDEAFAYYAE